LMKIIALQQGLNEDQKPIDSIVTTNILLYKSIKVSLINPDSSFLCERTFGEEWQEVDSTCDNRWRWNVIPVTNLPKARLIIKVTAQTPEGQVKDIDDKTFQIKVTLNNRQMFRDWWLYLRDNSSVVITVILIPLIAFFGKRYFERKAKKKKG
jgi:hypothetical protein